MPTTIEKIEARLRREDAFGYQDLTSARLAIGELLMIVKAADALIDYRETYTDPRRGSEEEQRLVDAYYALRA